MTNDDLKILQSEYCTKQELSVQYSLLDEFVGLADNVREGEKPTHGLRHVSPIGSTGWFIWAGNYSDRSDFFKPIHLKHLSEYAPKSLKFLGLPPGWRFLFADDYEDIWFDPSLLNLPEA